MAWTISEPVAGLSVTIVPSAGDVTITEDQTTVVIYAIRGGSPSVTDQPRRVRSIKVPELVFRSTAEFEKLRAIRAMSRRVLLTDDGGNAWPVRFTGGVSVRIVDTPDRPTAPLRYVTVALVGVV